MLQQDKITRIEDLLVEYHDIFARHRFDFGMNDESKVKSTPKYDSPAYSQILPTLFTLKEDILVELALLHRYGIITKLPFSKYASPIFVQKKSNGKLRPLVNLRKINKMISDDFINNNNFVSTLTDAAQHMAGHFFANWTVRKPTTIRKRPINGPSKCLLSTLLAEPSPIAD